MSNLIVLLDPAVLATCLTRLPLYCVDLNYCGVNLTTGVYRWPRTTSQQRSVAWQGPALPRRSRGARRRRAAPGGAGGAGRGAEGTAPAAPSAASAPPAPASPPPANPRGLSLPAKTHH